MSGTNPVATFALADYTVDTATAYKTKIDSNFIVLKREGDNFAPRQTTVPAMTVSLDPGHIFVGVTLTEVAGQTTSTITAPIGNPRIDRVVVDRFTGAYSVVTGTPAGSPVAPAIPSGKVPICQVLLQTSSTSITNSMITDERALNALGQGTISSLNQGSVILDDGVGNATIGTNVVTNSMLSQMTNLRIQSNISGSTANASGNTLTAILDAIMGNARGSILTRGASAWNVLIPGSNGTFLKSQGTGADLIYATPTGGLQALAPQIFYSSGTYTPSSGMVYCIVENVGGGGAGGAAGSNGSGSGGGGGGGSGAYARSILSAGTVGASKPVVIGTGGATSGAAGGTTTFGTTLVVANGGDGGGSGSGGSGGTPGVAGIGGTAGTGDYKVDGSAGANGSQSGTGSGINAGGVGGSSVFGGGGRGGCAAAYAPQAGAANTGGGGGGGCIGGGGSSGAGGGSGIVIITEFVG